MASPISIFDYCQTVFIIICLVFTIPLAFFVYFKLLFVRPFSENYTFKLIVVNGITELVNCVVYLITLQFTNFNFLNDFYISINTYRLNKPLGVLFALTDGFCLHTRLFIAMNRLKTIIFIQQISNDAVFFLISISLSLSLTLPALADYSIFSNPTYTPFNRSDGSPAVLPQTGGSNDILRTTSTSIRIGVSLATLLVNMVLAFLISRERRFIDFEDRKKFNGEKGLIITSIVTYAFYMLYCANNGSNWWFVALWCGYAQWLFLGLNSITPFWCLLLFTPSVRRLAFNRGNEEAIFDYCQSIFIVVCLVITIPLACFVYFKLIFVRPFSENYTFKLIALNGIAVSNFLII
ncbi:hypothetical protein PENTCL1PPCAC_16521, partial [Pristionchus entomophagus]